VTRRLVHVTTTDMSLELLLGPQLSAFVDAGYEVLGASAAGPYVDAIEARGVQHLPLRHTTRSMAPQHDVAALVELRRLFRDLRPDVVHTHNPKPGVYGRLAARAARVPAIVNTVHGLYALPDDPWAKRTVVYTLERVAARVSDAELVQNPEDVPTLRRLGVPAAKLTVLGNGVDLTRFRPDRLDPVARRATRAAWGADDGTVVVGAVGRLVWEKGYRELFAAARALVGHAPRIRFVIVGGLDAAKSDQLGPDDLAAAERDADLVSLGHRADVADLYGAMDVFVLASHREGFPRAAMEAAASGVPVVATDIRGCRQVVEPGRTGLLVPPRDTDALARAIGRLADAPATRAAMRDAALVKARAEFDDRRVVATTLATYDRILAARS
jgi:glycosyltransferase involved in cell wall biosynthesis